MRPVKLFRRRRKLATEEHLIFCLRQRVENLYVPHCIASQLVRAIRPERSIAERGRTSPKQLAGSVQMAEIKHNQLPAIRPERSIAERGRTSPKRLVGSVLKSEKIATRRRRFITKEADLLGQPPYL